jgi:hypothetical protein
MGAEGSLDATSGCATDGAFELQFKQTQSKSVVIARMPVIISPRQLALSGRAHKAGAVAKPLCFQKIEAAALSEQRVAVKLGS